jgi:type I restriction enzyme S subunit
MIEFLGKKGIRALTAELCHDGVERKELGGITSIITGTRDASYASESGDYPFYTCSPIIKRSKGATYSGEALLVPGNGNIGIVLHHKSGAFDAYQRVYILQLVKEGSTTLRYLYHIMKSSWAQSVKRDIQGGAMPYIKLAHLQDYLVPVPPLAVQEAIISYLDQFDTLVNDMNVGIPAEIAARRKQYEYYREQLLSFDQKAEEAEADE